MSNTIINQVIANGAVYANGFYGTGLANAYGFRSQSFVLDVGSANNRFVDVFNIQLATFSAAQATVYFYNYSSADRIEVYQGNTLIIDIGSAVVLNANDRAFVTGSKSGEFFNDSPDLYLKDFVPATIANQAYAAFAGKITWTHNPSKGTNYTVRTLKGDGSFDWRYIVEYPIDGNTVGCPPLPPTNPPPPPPPVIVTPSGGGGGCGCKIVCTAMNEAYGFGEFRQKVWLAHSAGLDPSYQTGYHALFLPLVQYLYYQGNLTSWHKRVLRYLLESVIKHRTADIWKQRHGKRDPLGRWYRAVFEPIVWAAGKLRS